MKNALSGALCALWLLAGAAVMPLVSAQEAPAQAQAKEPNKPNLTGSWKLKLEKSDFQIPKPTSATMSIEHREPKFSLSRTTIFAEGSIPSLEIFGYNSSIELTADGKPRQETGAGAMLIITLSWEQDELHLKFMIIDRDGGIGTDDTRLCLSADGGSIIASERISIGSDQLENRWVFEKQ